MPTGRCRYCLKSLNKKSMTKIPKNPTLRQIWIDILGEKFAETMKIVGMEQNMYFGHICRTHFEGAPKYRSADCFPIRMTGREENEARERASRIQKNGSTDFSANSTDENICRICDVKFDPLIYKIPIPTRYEHVNKFSEIFGQGFMDRIIEHPEPHFMCFSHVLEKHCETPGIFDFFKRRFL
ncbi:unnamed protein product [Caenorhabditis angaria]|uniref:THAP-type domain-containing protein n=1 Tax=Caenorhabditis angaria TaxID=860376 RepID=A0A9P1J5D3_9PELO|nr:unnamed protein product [Caenorhabditis angaria]